MRNSIGKQNVSKYGIVIKFQLYNIITHYSISIDYHPPSLVIHYTLCGHLLHLPFTVCIMSVKSILKVFLNSRLLNSVKIKQNFAIIKQISPH